ncbi:hypothetical protein P9112_000521 [Eukaryota sp. TZLM1-RC]
MFPKTVSKGQRVALWLDDHYFITDPISLDNRIKISKSERPLLSSLLELPFGSFVLVVKDKFERVPPPTLPEWPLSVEFDSDKTNVNINDDQTAQALNETDIAKLKDSDTPSDRIIQSLVENSKTFTNKTVFAQQKYIARKKRKHCRIYRIDHVTYDVLCLSFLKKSPDRICFLTPDAISYILSLSNSGHSTSPALVFDSTDGLLYGSIVSRSSDRSVYFAHSSFACRHHLSSLLGNPSPSLAFTVATLASMDPINATSFTAVVSPTEMVLVLALWKHLVIGSPFVFWSISIDGLTKLRLLFKKYNLALSLSIKELNVTPMVFLPGISRPDMNFKPGNGGGDGFFLCGYKSREVPNELIPNPNPNP